MKITAINTGHVPNTLQALAHPIPTTTYEVIFTAFTE